MKANIIKRMLCGALALSLVLAPSMSTLASSTTAKVQGNVASEVQESAPTVAAYKHTSSVAGITTRVSGAYILNKGIGVAVLGTPAEIATAYGFGANEKAYVKATDFDAKRSDLANKCLVDTATALGGKVVGAVNVELGKMTGGKYSLLTEGPEVELKLGVPKNAQGSRLALVRVQSGGVVTVWEDTDNNPATISATLAPGAGVYAIVAY